MLQDFNEAVISDPYILEIFTLLNKGIYEHFITSKLEEERRNWFMRSTKFITLLLNSCVSILDEKGTHFDSSPNIGVDSRLIHQVNPFVSPEKTEKRPDNQLLGSISNQSHEEHINNEQLQNKQRSDFSEGNHTDFERRKQKSHTYDNVFDKHPLQKIELITEGVLNEGRQSDRKFVDPDKPSRLRTNATTP